MADEPEVLKTLTEEVTPLEFHIEIKPDDWKANGTIFEAEITVPGIYESGITKAYPDEDKMKENAKNKSIVYKLINDIFEKEILEIKSETYKIMCKFIGNKPTESIFLDIEQLPFPDCPGSKLGI